MAARRVTTLALIVSPLVQPRSFNAVLSIQRDRRRRAALRHHNAAYQPSLRDLAEGPRSADSHPERQARCPRRLLLRPSGAALSAWSGGLVGTSHPAPVAA